MNKQFKFTTTTLRALPVNPADSRSTELEFSDTEITGLKCLSGKSGSKRFLLRYVFKGKRTSIALGRFPDVDISLIRKVARKIKGDIASGLDPKRERITSKEVVVPTIKQFFFETYLPLAKKRKRTWNDDIARFKLCQSIHNTPYDKLTPKMVLDVQLSLLDGINEPKKYYAPATCNRVIALLKTLGKQANDYLNIDNVALKVSLLPENNIRTRYCDVIESKSIIHAALDYHCKSIGSYIALLFLTGCRVSELKNRLWTDVDFNHKALNIPRTKNGSSHIVYLSEYMLSIIKRIPKITGNPYLFAGYRLNQPINVPRHAFEVIKKNARIKNPDEVVFHTARHSVASNLISNGTDIAAVQKLLNHRCIESTLRYAKLSASKQRETTQSLSNLINDCNPLNARI